VWVTLWVALYVTWDLYLHPISVKDLSYARIFETLWTFETWRLIMSYAWADPSFRMIGLLVAAFLLVWSCFVSAMLVILLDIEDAPPVG